MPFLCAFGLCFSIDLAIAVAADTMAFFPEFFDTQDRLLPGMD